MENSDDDEDFIPKGTPLYDYLVQIGVMDPAAEEQKTSKASSPLETYLGPILEKLKTWYCSILGPTTTPLHDNLRLQTGHAIHAVFSRLLLRDDFVLLHHLKKDIPISSGTHIPWKLPLISAILVGVVSMAVASTFMGMVALVATVCLAAMTNCVSHFYIRIFLQRSLFRSCSQLVTQLLSLLTLLNRCLKYLRESEVVEFGYTMHSLCIQSRKSNNSDNRKTSDFSEVKQRLALMLREIFFTFQKATQELRSSVPLEEFDLESFYLQHLSLADFNLHLELDMKDPEQKAQFCNFFAKSFASNLKTLFDLTLAQVSEYLRRLCLCFLAGSTNSSVVTLFHCCQHQINPLLHLVTDQLASTERFHQVHCTVHTTTPPPELPRSVVPLDSPLSTAVHDLQLNLHCLLSSANQLEELIATDKVDYEGLQSKMLEINGVFSHTSGLMTQTAKLISLQNKAQDEKCPEILASSVPPPPPTYHIPDADPIICDQVFIGRADPVKVSTDYSVSDCELLKPPSQKLAFKDVFQELKVVIAVKAEEHKQREAKALAMTSGAEDDSSDSSEEDATPSKIQEEDIEEDIPKFECPALPSNFSSMIAAMAQQHTQRLGLSEETFCDSDDSDEL